MTATPNTAAQENENTISGVTDYQSRSFTADKSDGGHYTMIGAILYNHSCGIECQRGAVTYIPAPEATPDTEGR